MKGPAAKMMAELGGPVSGLRVARLYARLIDRIVLDEEDGTLLGERQKRRSQAVRRADRHANVRRSHRAGPGVLAVAG